MTKKKAIIDPFTLIPLHIETYFDDTALSWATGFILKEGEQHFLITNWHVVSGRHPDTDKPLSKTAAIPNELGVWFHRVGPIGSWVRKRYSLLSEGKPQWLEHSMGHVFDVVAIPFEPDDDIVVHGIDLVSAERELYLPPSAPVSIVGFPKGISAAGKFPIYKTGHVASDLDIPWDGKPVFLIDATTKEGMSGAPVVANRSGGYATAPGSMRLGSITKFLGVYSGREISEEGIEIGRVWKPIVISEIIHNS